MIGDRAALVEVVEFARGHRFAHRHQRRQRHHRVVARAHEEFFDVVGRGAAGRRGLHDDVVLVRATLVARHVASAEHRLDGARHLVHGHAEVRRTVAVDFDQQLRLVQPQVGVGLHEAGVLLHLGDDGLRRALQVLIGIVGDDDEVDRLRAEALAQARRRDRKGAHARQRREFGLHRTRGGLRAAAALAPIPGAQDHRALGDAAVEAAAEEDEDAVEVRLFHRDVADRIEIAPRVLERRAFRRRDRQQDHATILHRRQLGLGGAEQPPAADAAGQHDDEHDPALVEHGAERAAIRRRQADQRAFHRAVEPARLRVVAQQLAAHHRRQRQRDETGHQDRTGQRQRELDEQAPGAAGREGQRREDRGQRERHRHDRER